ncbi:MAG: aldehyde dehydrogenase family protein, partial [Hyphomicrobiaceae bacterium]
MTKSKSPSIADNSVRLEKLLTTLKRDGIGHTINGQRVDSPATFDTTSPVDKSVIAKVARGTASDIDKAAKAAAAAFKPWAAWAPEKRRALLHKIADAIEARA